MKKPHTKQNNKERISLGLLINHRKKTLINTSLDILEYTYNNF